MMRLEGADLKRLVLLAVALGEIGTGIVLLAFPQVFGVLIDAALDPAGQLAARMGGVAILALGSTWWLARHDPYVVARNGVGFLIYNVGVGALFIVQGVALWRSALPWIVGIVHLGAAFAFMTLRERPVAKE